MTLARAEAARNTKNAAGFDMSRIAGGCSHNHRPRYDSSPTKTAAISPAQSKMSSKCIFKSGNSPTVTEPFFP